MTDIVSVLNLINYGFVLIFGIIVSFYFAGIQWEDNKRLFILTTVLFILFQALFYVLLGEMYLITTIRSGIVITIVTTSEITGISGNIYFARVPNHFLGVHIR